MRVTLGTGWLTLLRKELVRFWKVSFQTVAAPVLTSLLYLLIFSHVLEQHVAVTHLAEDRGEPAELVAHGGREVRLDERAKRS